MPHTILSYIDEGRAGISRGHAPPERVVYAGRSFHYHSPENHIIRHTGPAQFGRYVQADGSSIRSAIADQDLV